MNKIYNMFISYNVRKEQCAFVYRYYSEFENNNLFNVQNLYYYLFIDKYNNVYMVTMYKICHMYYNSIIY